MYLDFRWALPLDCVILLLVLALLCYCCSSRSVSCVSFFSCVWMPLVYLLTLLIICSVPRWLASFVSACFDVWCRPLFSALLYLFILFSLPDRFVLFVSFLNCVLLVCLFHYSYGFFIFSTLSSYLSSFGFIPDSILPLCFPSFLSSPSCFPLALLVLQLSKTSVNTCCLLKIPFPTTLEWIWNGAKSFCK